MQPFRRENDPHIRDSSRAFLQMIYGEKDLDLAAGAKLGPYEIAAPLGTGEWGRCSGRGIRGWAGRQVGVRCFPRILRPFTRVHPEEAATVAVMTVAAFLMLTAYYLLKTVREPLILLEGGAEVKLYARAGQAVLMVWVLQLYGELARRVGRMKLLMIVFLFFISNLAVFAVLARAHVAIGLPFFLWVGVFSYTMVAQFWALVADIYDEEQGKRLSPMIGGGSSVGAVAGGLFAKVLVPFGPSVLMGTAVVLC